MSVLWGVLCILPVDNKLRLFLARFPGLAPDLPILWVQLVTLKYTQYGGEGYLRGGEEGVSM